MSIPNFLKNCSKGCCNLVFDNQVVFHHRKIPSSWIIAYDIYINLPNDGDKRLILISQVCYVKLITISSAPNDSPHSTRGTLQLMTVQGWGRTMHLCYIPYHTVNSVSVSVCPVTLLQAYSWFTTSSRIHPLCKFS